MKTALPRWCRIVRDVSIPYETGNVIRDAADVFRLVRDRAQSEEVEAFNVRTVRRDATLGTDARWMFPGETWRGYLGAGVAVHFLSDEVDAPSLGDHSHALTKGGLALLGGVAFGTKARLGNFLEVKGHLVGGFKQLKINMGLSWNH